MTTIHPGPFGFYVRSYWGTTLLSILLFAGAYAAYSAGGLGPWAPAALALAGVLLLLLGWGHAIFHSRTTTLSLEGMEVTYQTGVLNRTITTVAVGQITDSSITRDLLDNLLGSATFKINTSGSTDYEVNEGGFSFQQASAMRDQIYALIDKQKPAKKPA